MPNTESLFDGARTRRPGARRQAIIAVVVVATLLAVLGLGFLAARPADRSPVLRSAPAAPVLRRTLRDLVTVGGTLELARTESLVSPERAAIVEVRVAEGDEVAAGQVVAVVADDDLRTQLDSKKAALDKVLRDIVQAEAMAGYDTRAQALAESKARRELATAQGERDRVAALLERKLAARAELDTAEAKLSAEKEALESLLLSKERGDTLDRIQAQNRDSDRRLLEDVIAQLEAGIAACTVRAGSAGVVYSLSAKKGKMAAQYEELAVIGDPASIRATVDLPETRAAAVKVGTTASVYIGGTPYPGTVSYIARYATSSSSGSAATVQAWLEFARRPEGAVAGASVTADLQLGEIPDALVLPRGPYLTSGDYAAAYVVEGAVARKKAVSFGTADGQSIQILSGLSEGDLVLTGNYAEFLHLDEVKVEGIKKE